MATLEKAPKRDRLSRVSNSEKSDALAHNLNLKTMNDRL